MIARVGAMRVRNTKIICYLKNPSLSNCKQIREAMCAYIERENIKLGGATPYVLRRNLFGDKSNKGLLEKRWEWPNILQRAQENISTEWYPFYQVYVHESEASQPIPLLSTASGAPVVNAQGAEMLGTTVDKLVMACRRGTQ